MEKNKCGNRYSPEVRERAVRMVFEHQGEFDSQSAAIKSIAPKIGCGPHTLRAWVRQRLQIIVNMRHNRDRAILVQDKHNKAAPTGCAARKMRLKSKFEPTPK